MGKSRLTIGRNARRTEMPSGYRIHAQSLSCEVQAITPRYGTSVSGVAEQIGEIQDADNFQYFRIIPRPTLLSLRRSFRTYRSDP